MASERIIVIGAGAAGVAAAVRLICNGFKNIIILEAESRLGGRIHSINFEGHLVELGAQWCHGEDGNVVYQMVKDLNVLNSSKNDYFDNTYYKPRGVVADKKVSQPLTELAFEVYAESESIKNRWNSFGDYFNEKFDSAVAEKFNGENEYLENAPLIKDWICKLLLTLDPAPNWYEFTISGHSQYKNCPGNLQLNWGDNGFYKIIEELMIKVPNTYNLQEKIFFNKRVTNISYSSNEVILTCADNSTYKAPKVILTVSLGVLKATYKELFSPPLPISKQMAIEGIAIGEVVKIFLKFDRKWWPDSCQGFSLLWTNEAIDSAHKEFPFGPQKKGVSWLVGVFGFYVVDNHPNVLMAWVVGECAKEVEMASDEVLLKGCTYLLDKFVGIDVETEAPRHIISSKWCQNPNFKGCYSYISLKTEKMDTCAAKLAEPIFENGNALLFAGEATHPYYYSTVHGAVESGFREADRIINMNRNGNPTYLSKI